MLFLLGHIVLFSQLNVADDGICIVYLFKAVLMESSCPIRMVLVTKFVVLIFDVLLARSFGKPKNFIVVDVGIELIRSALLLIVAPK